MDYLYGQLPEVVYDPADLKGDSPGGTIRINIDNQMRELSLDVLKTPGKLIIRDPESKLYEYDGSENVIIDTAGLFNIEITFETASEEDIANGIPTFDSKVGDGYLKIKAPASSGYVYVPIPTPVASGEVQKITSIDTIYANRDALPKDAPIGAIYPVRQNVNRAQTGGIVLYEKVSANEWDEKAAVVEGNIYAIVESGLLAISTKSNGALGFTVLNSALENAINNLKEEFETSLLAISDRITTIENGMQDSLSFTDTYDKDNNKVVVESTLDKSIETAKEEVTQVLNSKVEEIEGSFSSINNNIEDISDRVEEAVSTAVNNKIEEIKYMGRDGEISYYTQILKDGTEIDFTALTPKGDAGTLEIVKVNTGNPGTDASVINVNDNEVAKDSHAQLEITIPRGYDAEIKNVNVEMKDPEFEAQAILSSNSDYLPGQTDITFQLPRGEKGDAATIGVGITTTLNPGEDATVNITGTSTTTDAFGNPIYNDAILSFGIPAGKPAVIEVGDVLTGDPGTDVEVTNDETDELEDKTLTKLNFKIPAGKNSEVKIESIFKLNPWENPKVTNTIDKEATNEAGENIILNTLNFEVPQGVGIESATAGDSRVEGDYTITPITFTYNDKETDPTTKTVEVLAKKGEQGPQGIAGKIVSVTAELGKDSADVGVVNKSGDESNAELHFTVPTGQTIVDAESKVDSTLPDDKLTKTEVTFKSNLDEEFTVDVYAEKGDTGVGITDISAEEAEAESGYTYTETPVTITTDDDSYGFTIKAKDGVSISHEWVDEDGSTTSDKAKTYLKLNYSDGSSSGDPVNLRGEKGDAANIVVTESINMLSSTSNAYVDIDKHEESNTTTITFNIPRGEKGEKGDPLQIAKFFSSKDDMDADALLPVRSDDPMVEISPVPVGSFVVTSETSEEGSAQSNLYIKTEGNDPGTYKYDYVATLGELKTSEDIGVASSDYKPVIKLKQDSQTYKGEGVTLGLEISGNTLNLKATNGEDDSLLNSVRLPATGATSLVKGEPNEDGTFEIWLEDSDGVQLGEKIEVSASTGTGTTSYYYVVSNLLSSLKFNVTDAEEEVALRFKCEEKEVGQLISGTTSTVVIEYSTDKVNYKALDTLTAPNGEEVEFKYKVKDLRNGINYFRVICTAGVAENTSGEKLSKTLNYEINLIECKVISNFDFYKAYNASITLQYSCIGAGLNKTTYLKVSDKNENIIYQDSQDYGTSSSDSGSARSFNINKDIFKEHGVYKIDLYYTYDDGAKESAHLKYDLMFNMEKNSPLLSAYIPTTRVTYGDEITVEYAVSTDNEVTPGVTPELKRSIYYFNGDGDKIYLQEFEDVNVDNDNKKEWPINFGAVGFPLEGTLYVELDTIRGSSKTFIISVEPLEGIQNIILHDTLKIAYIAPTGQSNSISNAESLNVNFEDQQGTSTVIKAEMIDFNYNSNGFLQDGTTNIVRMSGDARLRIHLPLFRDNYVDSEGNEIKLQSKQSSGRTAEFRFKVSNVTNTNTSVINFLNVSSSSSLKLQGSGFRVQPKQAFIIDSSMPIDYDFDGNVKYPQSVAVTHFCDNEIIRLSFVVEPHSNKNKQSLRIYVNGELTRIIPYNKTTTLQGPEYIELGSNDCVLDLYSAVFYEKALSESDILTNYLADIPIIKDRIKEFDLNKVQNDSGKRTNSDYYWTNDKNEKKDLSKNFDSMLLYDECRKRIPCILTTGPMSSVKGDKTKVGAIYTKPDKDGNVVTIFSSSKNCQTNVQGTTSSKLYPRYNYKITTKNESGDKVRLYLVKNESGVIEIMNGEEVASLQNEQDKWVGESTFCWKADVMSPDHANTVNAVWFSNFFSDLTSPQESNKRIHPNVWGCRCLLFNRLTEEGEISFMGDGCLNNDKSNSDTFGLSFDGDEDDTDNYWKNEEGNSIVTKYIYKYIKDEKEESLKLVENSDGDIETKCQKWEFLDNGPNICNFKDALFFKKNEDGDYFVLDALESTYPDQGDIEDCDIGFVDVSDGELTTTTKPHDITPNYGHIQLAFLWVLKRANFWKQSNDADDEPKDVPKNGFVDGSVSKTYNGVPYDNEYAYRRAIFEKEFQLHFNLDHTLTYYIACNITALIDNWAKNMFLTCYDTRADKIVWINDNKYGIRSLHGMIEYAKAHDGDIPEDCIDWVNSEFAVWYPTLYDLDSCYGVDNKGYKWVPYYADWNYQKWGGMQDESTDEDGNTILLPPAPIMNGSQSYFWRMFYDVFYANIKTKYKTLANGYLNLSNWKDIMVNKNIDTVPVRITTEDSIFKYAMPWFYGYTKDNYTDYSETSEFLYLIQANKKLQDIDFMTQRFNMYDSEFDAPSYTNDTLKVLLPSGASGNVSFEMTPIQDMWCGVQFATQKGITKSTRKVKAGESIAVNGEKTSEDTITIYGASLLQEIKGLDILYGTTYELNNAINLRKLKIGNDRVNNNNTKNLNIANCKMLEELDIVNCKGISSIDTTNNGLIEKIIAKGSGLNSITLPNGGYLEEIYLPPLQSLIIKNQENLSVFQMGTYSGGDYTSDYSKLNTLYVEGNMSAIPLANIMKDSLSNLTGIRLSNVILDLSEWGYNDTSNFITMLTDDTLKGKQIDINGVNVSMSESDPSTWYPVITGTLKINNDHIDAALDLKLTQIVNRYPTLYLAPPESVKNFTQCWWSEIAAVCDAAMLGKLKNDAGEVCGILDKTDENGVTIEGWWDIGDSKKDPTKEINIYIADSNNPEVKNYNGDILQLNLIAPIENAVTSLKYKWNDNSSNKNYMGKISVDWVSNDGTVLFSSEPTSIGSENIFSYSGTSNAHKAVVKILETTFINTIRITGSPIIYEFQDPITQTNTVTSSYRLAYTDLGYDSRSRNMPFPHDNSNESSISLNSDNLIINCSNGSITVNGIVNGNASNDTQSTQFNPGTQIELDLKGNSSITIKGHQSYDVGYVNSSIHEYINSEDFLNNNFSQSFLNVMKMGSFKSNIGRLSSDATTEYAKVYLPSLVDLNVPNANGFNVNKNAYLNETSRDNALRIMYSNTIWVPSCWTRSPAQYTMGSASCITESKALSTAGYNQSYNLQLRFNI